MEKKLTGEHGVITNDGDELFVGGCKSFSAAIEEMLYQWRVLPTHRRATIAKRGYLNENGGDYMTAVAYYDGETGDVWEAMTLAEAMDAMKALAAVAMDKKVTYAIMHDGEFLYTTTSYDVEQEERLKGGLTKLALALSDVKVGAVYLLSVEKSVDKGWEDHNLVAVARDGARL